MTPNYRLGTCQNCDVELSPEQVQSGKLFCSEKCTQTASAVRYGRSALRDGRFNDPDVRAAIKIKIDHIHGSSSDPENLRAICRSCNMAKFYEHAKPAPPEKVAEARAIMARIKAEYPARLCDDEGQWATLWRVMAKEQKTLR
jgi:hypothetical protein